MSYTEIEENTLGVRRGASGRPARASAADAKTGRPSTTLGIGFIGIGALIIFGLRAVYGLVWFASYWTTYPMPLAAAVAWLVILVTVSATLLCAKYWGDRLPTGAFVLFLAGIALTIALDFMAIWELHDIGRYATASATAGMALVVVITLRGTREISAAAIGLGLAFLGAMVVNTPLTSQTLAQQITTLAFAVFPSIIGVGIVRAYRRLVQVELDRVLVQSTVSAPRFAIGMMASEELARLDLAAEELLDSVASGAVELPLSPQLASRAASLATELRLHLIEGRRETWLYHAISESDLLGKTVTLTDRGSLAGLMGSAERDGLLAAVWLLVSDNSKSGGAGRTVQITLGPARPPSDDIPASKILVPIVVTTTGVQRNRVDPATWEAFGNVGRYSDSTPNSSLRVDIECLVDNPAEK